MKVSSAILTEMSGKLGGAVAAKARGGVQYFRALVTPSNPRSTAQSRMRLILSGLSAAWLSVLTGTQRAGWSAVAGETSSGIDAYVKVNSQVALTGQTRVDTAPTSISLAAEPLTAISYNASLHALAFTNSTFSDDLYVNVYINQSPQSPSRGAQQRHTTFYSSVHLDAAGANSITPTNFPAIYNAAIGTVFYARFVQVDVTGKVAVEQLVRIVVT